MLVHGAPPRVGPLLFRDCAVAHGACGRWLRGICLTPFIIEFVEFIIIPILSSPSPDVAGGCDRDRVLGSMPYTSLPCFTMSPHHRPSSPSSSARAPH